MKTRFYYTIASIFVSLISVTLACVNEPPSPSTGIENKTVVNPEAIWEYQGQSKVVPKIIEELKSNHENKVRMENSLLNNNVLWEESAFLLIENKKRILVPVLSYSKSNIIAILSLARNKAGKTQWNVTFRWDLAKKNVQLPFWESGIWHGYFLALDKDLLGLENGNPGISDKFTNVAARSANSSKSSASTSSCVIGERCIYNFECVTYDEWETYTCTTELDYCEPIIDEGCYYNDDGGDTGGTGGTGGGDTGGGDENYYDDKIDDTELVGKAKCAFEKLKTTNGNLFNETIGVFGIPGEKYNLKFTYDDCNTDGEMCTDPSDLVNNNLTIKIDNITGLSVLELAANFLHEGIHAEIYRYVNENGGNVNPNDRINLYNWYMDYKVQSGSVENTDIAQHQHMADMYIYPIARAIRELDNKRFDVEAYLPFAWSGLSAYGKDGYYNEDLDFVFFDLENMEAKIDEIVNTTSVGNDCDE